MFLGTPFKSYEYHQNADEVNFRFFSFDKIIFLRNIYNLNISLHKQT